MMVKVVLIIAATFLISCVPLPVLGKNITNGAANFSLSVDDEDIIAYSNILREIVNTSAYMFYTLYTRSLGNNPINITYETFSTVQTHLMYNKQFKFVTHGWLSSGTAESCTLIKDGYLRARDINVIILDWSAIADNNFYPSPAIMTQCVGQVYGDFLNFMIENGMSLDLTHLLGHSLGAHVSAIAAREIDFGKASRLSGFDPALPAFSSHSALSRISSDDAEFVDIIHTSAGSVGIAMAVGTVDFFPNGGTAPQPGCSLPGFSCSHGRSYEYFAESINVSHRFVSRQCKNYIEYRTTDKCDQNVKTLMGDPVNLTISGTFFLRTNSEYPYAKSIRLFAN